MTSLDPNINCYRPILQSDAACASHEAAEGAQRSLASGNAPNGPRTLSQSQSNSSEGDAQDEEFRMLVHAYLHDMDYTSSNLAVLNLVHSITNAGLVALPYAASCAGIPLFTLTVLVIAVVSGYSAIVMIGLANEQKVRTLEDLAEVAFGRRGFYAVCVFQFTFSFCLISITLDVWAEIMVDIFRAVPLQQLHFFMDHRGQVVLGAGLILPVCLLKSSMSTMRWTSYVAVGALTAALLSVVGIYSTQKDESSSQSSSFGLFYNQEYGASNITVDELSPYRFLSTDDASPNGNAGMHGPTGAGKEELIPHSYWWIVFFVLSFCYSFNQKAFNVYCRLRRRNTHRWRLVVRRATCISGLLYLIFGVFGFLAYLKQDDGEASADVLKKVNFFSENNYTNKLIFDIARSMVAGCLLLTIPVDCLVAVTSWRRLRNKYNKHMQNSLRLQSSDYVTAAQRQLKNELHQDDEPFEEVSPMRCGILEGESHNSWSAKGSAKCNSYNLSSKTVNISSSNTSGSQHYSERNSDGAETQNRIATGCAADANSCDPTVDGSNTPGTIDVEANSTQVIDSNSETLDEDLRSSDSCHSATCRAGEWEDDVLPKVRSESSHKVRSSRLASSETLQSRKFLTDSWNSSVVIHSDGGSGSRHLSGWDFGLDGSEIVHSRGTGPAQTDSASYRDGSFVDLNLESTEGTESTRTHRTKKSCKSAIRQSFCSSYVAWNSLNRITCCAQEKSGVDLLIPRSSRRESIEIAITTIVLWGFAVGMNLLLGDSWMYLATTVGTISTAILVFIVPSTAYYRLGLASDFQAIPICGVIPNRALMFIVQIIGILLLLGNLAEVVYFNV